MKLKKNKLEPDDFFYFSLPLRSPAADLKTMRFFLWTAVIGLVVGYFYFFDYAQEVVPLTGPLVLVYLLLALISLLCLFTLMLFKTKIYEPMAYFMVGLLFLGFSYIVVIISYTEFFMKNNDMEVFQTINTHLIEMKKVVLLNRLLLVPMISFILSISFHMYVIKTGKTSKSYRHAKKFEENSRNFNKLVPTLSATIFASAFFIGMFNITEGNLMLIFYVFGSMIFSIFAPSLMVTAYMKKKFPEIYLEKNINKGVAE